MLKRVFERGDTLIEVLFAISVFSFVVVGSLAIMNQGTAAAQRSVEITLVREQIDAQAETLRFLHSSYVNRYQSGGIEFDTTDRDPITNQLITSPAEEWYKLKQYVDTADLAADDYDNTSCPTSPLPGSFIVDPKAAKFVSTSSSLIPVDDGYAQITYNAGGAVARGIWIRAISSTTSTDAGETSAGYVDYHIRACWGSAGVSLPITIGTIVRLYEPRG